MVNSDISCFENSVDPDQLASRKPADQDLYCFQLYLSKHANNWYTVNNLDKNWGRVTFIKIQHSANLKSEKYHSIKLQSYH